jgi:hypothetical protein
MRKCCVLLGATVLGGCATGPLPSWVGSYEWDGGVANTDVVPVKNGEACAHSVLGITWGDASIERARLMGGIQRIATVDHQTTNAVLYGRHCTLVRGD